MLHLLRDGIGNEAKGRGVLLSPHYSLRNGLCAAATGRVKLPQHFVLLKVKPYWIPLSVDLIYVCFSHLTDVSRIAVLFLKAWDDVKERASQERERVSSKTDGSGQMCKEFIDEVIDECVCTPHEALVYNTQCNITGKGCLYGSSFV